ncbi:hypothetical protein Dimus_025773 [Dionaea muscipula]
MAKLGPVLPILTLLSLALSVLGSTAFENMQMEPATAPMGDDNDEIGEGFAPEPSVVHNTNTLEEENTMAYRCASKMDLRCAEEVYMWVELGNEGKEVSRECCRKLREVGVDCHMACLAYILEKDDMFKTASPIILRGQQIWERCGLGEGSPAPSPFISQDKEQ